MTKPVRLQLSRKLGFNLQELSLATNGLPAVNVARPTKFGNPFTIALAIEAEYAKDADDARPFVVNCFRGWVRGSDSWWQGQESDKARSRLTSSIDELRGKNLACFCPPGPCHADVLLELANRVCEEV